MTQDKGAGRRVRSYIARQVDIREPKQRFLIICEGKKTEPYYFEGLRQHHRLNAVIKVMGLGLDPTQLVNAAQTEKTQDSYDQVWCVFDRDTWPTQNFNNALKQAKRYRIKVAYSNECFELWYVLHFNYCDSAISRQQYAKSLDSLLGHPYLKNSPSLYSELFNRQQHAQRHAETLLQQYNLPNPAYDNPSTTVHHLVAELLRYAE